MESVQHIGKRIGDIRTLAKISQSELARRMNVSPSLVSHWEAGTRTLSQAQLMLIARHLGVSLDYLMNEKVQPTFQFRAKSTLDAAQKAAVNRALLDASTQTYFVENVQRMAQKPVQTFGLKADFSFPQVSNLALTFRDTLKLNRRATLGELKQALADWGIFVFDWALPYHISGMSYRGALTVIFINNLHQPTRRLFTLAHEFAHVLFHLGRNEETTSVSVIASNQDPQEKEANSFASEFLIPAADVRAIADTYGSRLKDPAVLEVVARAFHVSRDAVFYRLTQLGVFRWEEKSKYFTGHVEPEPRELRVTKIEEQVPGNFLETALSLYFSEQVSAGKLAEWFFTSRLHVEDYLFELSTEKDNALAETESGLTGQDGDTDL